MTQLIVGVALAALTGIALVQPAEAAKARCDWDGQSRVCMDQSGHLHRAIQKKMFVGVGRGGSD